MRRKFTMTAEKMIQSKIKDNTSIPYSVETPIHVFISCQFTNFSSML